MEAFLLCGSVGGARGLLAEGLRLVLFFAGRLPGGSAAVDFGVATSAAAAASAAAGCLLPAVSAAAAADARGPINCVLTACTTCFAIT